MEPPLAIIAAVAAALSAVFVFFQVREMKRQTALQLEIRQASEQPYIWADIDIQQPNGWMLELVVGNSGPSVATNVRVRIDPPIKQAAGHEHLDAVFSRLAQGVASLAPGRRLYWTLGSSPDLVGGTGPFAHTVSIDCDGPFGPIPRAEYVIDLSDLKDSVAKRHGSLREISKSVDDVTKVLKEVVRKIESNES